MGIPVFGPGPVYVPTLHTTHSCVDHVAPGGVRCLPCSRPSSPTLSTSTRPAGVCNGSWRPSRWWMERCDRTWGNLSTLRRTIWCCSCGPWSRPRQTEYDIFLLVFVTPDHGVTLFGCVVQRRKQWTLLPLQAQYYHHNPHQLPQFTLTFRPVQALTIRAVTGDMVHDIVACGYALPALLPFAVPAGAQTYGILTDEMFHLHIDGALKLLSTMQSHQEISGPTP
jgi:hypothetical protein